jgi:microcystin-dependent protein
VGQRKYLSIAPRTPQFVQKETREYHPQQSTHFRYRKELTVDQYLGSLLLVPYNFVPQYFAACNGQLIQIAQNSALFSLIGTTFGGNGTSDFALPNLPGPKDASGGQLTWIIAIEGVFPSRN